MSIHHVTAIAGDPQRNLDFYAGLLGLRLVKLTVNFDDPGSYHLYFGDEAGRPGSILTFFPWPDGRRGRQGTGQVGTVSLAIPPASLGWWIERLLQHGIKYDGPARRFDEQVLAFADPDGLLLELVATPRVADVAPWADGPVPAEHAVRGVHGATVWEDGDRGRRAWTGGGAVGLARRRSAGLVGSIMRRTSRGSRSSRHASCARAEARHATDRSRRDWRQARRTRPRAHGNRPAGRGGR